MTKDNPEFHPNLVRPPAVAGIFYPGNRRELVDAVRFYLSEAKDKIPLQPTEPPKAIIVPHAG